MKTILLSFAVTVLIAAAQIPLPKSEVTITQEGDYRVITANGIPDHKPGAFPNRGNPNTIAPQKYAFRVPLNPKPDAETTAVRMYPFGVALNGVVFDPGAAEWWQGDHNWQYEPLSGNYDLGTDDSNAHVQPNGAYHYHGMPYGWLKQLTGGQNKMVQLGWAADGFPIYNNYDHTDPKDPKSPLKKLVSSYHFKKGQRPANSPGGTYDGTFVADYEYVKGSGDLDECNGRFGPTPEFPQGIYHYCLTDVFPFIPRMLRGIPDPSFFRKGPPRGPGGAGGPGQRPGPGAGPQQGGPPPR
jgi:hypothetical protein